MTGKILRFSCSYDARGRLVRVTNGNGACVRYMYDVCGNRIKEELIIRCREYDFGILLWLGKR